MDLGASVETVFVDNTYCVDASRVERKGDNLFKVILRFQLVFLRNKYLTTADNSDAIYVNLYFNYFNYFKSG